MPCQVLVSYLSGRPTGDIIAVLPSDHVFSKLETLEGWLSASVDNARDNWPRSFTRIVVTDKTEAELAYLTNPLMVIGANGLVPSVDDQYFFTVPAAGTDEYLALNTEGEITCSWSVAALFLQERG